MSEPERNSLGLTRDEDNARTNKIWDDLMGMSGIEFMFEIGRDQETVDRDGPDKGISQAGLDVLFRHLWAYIGTRMRRYYNQTGQPAQQVSVRIKVALNNAPADFDDSLTTVELPRQTVGDFNLDPYRIERRPEDDGN